jgi:hypothetical protein
MARFITRLAAGAALVVALALPSLEARAAGPYDGTWVVDFPASAVAGANATSPTCAAIRLSFAVKDNQISARLQRTSPSGNVVENSNAANAQDVTGTVGPDGAIAARWGNFTASGRLVGTDATVLVNGECGPRTGHGVKVE